MRLLAVSRQSSRPALFYGGAVAQLGERLVRNEEVRGSTPLGSTSLRALALSESIGALLMQHDLFGKPASTLGSIQGQAFRDHAC